MALPILAYRLSGSPSVTALTAAAEATPDLLVGLPAGALTDRWNRKKVIVVADVLSTTLIATVPLAHWLGEVTVPHVLAVAFLGPTIGVVLDGAVFGAVPTLVGRDRIAEANAVVWGLQSVSEIVLPPLVGLALAVIDPSTLLTVDALSFAVSAALVATIVRPMHDVTRERPPLTARQLLADIGEGLGFLLRHAGVRTMTVVGALQCVTGGGFVSLLVVWADRRLDVGTEGLRFGIVWSAWSVGSLVTAMVVPRVLQRIPAAGITLGALPFSAAAALVIPFLTTWWHGAVGLAVWSLFYTAIVLNSVSYRQQVTPEHLLSRVNTAGRMLAWGLGWSGGALLAAAVVGPLGLVPTLVCFAALSLVSVTVAWTSPLRRAAFDRDPVPAPGTG